MGAKGQCALTLARPLGEVGSTARARYGQEVTGGALTLCLLAAVALAGSSTLELEPEDLVRVDVPDYPGALATSAQGSLLLAPPEDLAWRPEPIGVPDTYDAWEAKEAMDVEPWHEAGVDGSGVKVAVFDYLWFGSTLETEELGAYATHDCLSQRSCDLPFDPESPQFGWEEGSHGLACAEVIRDLAPGVELHLVRVNGLTSLENGVDWAAREGIDVISMSLSFFGESFYDGTGAISAAAERFSASGGVFVTSAGNYAEEHLADSFRDGDADGWHEWPSGLETLSVELSEGTSSVLVHWDEFGDCGQTDLDVYVLDKNGDVVGRSENLQEPIDEDTQGCSPTEKASVTASYDGWYWIMVRRAAGEEAPRMALFARGGELYSPTPEGSIVDPGSSAATFTVGAVRATASYLSNGPESFSSWGPTRGGLSKPDVSGPDGLSTSVYGPSGFYGTSAATPAVAAAVALVLSGDPSLTPQQAAERVRATAWSSDALWAEPDPGLGAGRARLPPPETSVDEGVGCGGRGALLPGLLWFMVVRKRRLEARCELRP